MKIISIQKNQDPDLLDTHWNMVGDLSKVTSGSKVLILVHGVNNEPAEALAAYTVIDQKLGDQYDHVIGILWPGGDRAYEYFSAKSRANSVGVELKKLIAMIDTTDIDIIAHSMGNRVVLKALKGLNSKIRHFFSMAAVSDNESLEESEEFNSCFNSISSAVAVFHSSKDRVLKLAYRIAEFDRALGLTGPEDNALVKTESKLWVCNCKHIVKSHGDYKYNETFARKVK